MDIPLIAYEGLVRAALQEDIGPGDITTTLCIPENAEATATILAKSPGVIAGLDVAALAFRLLDQNVQWAPRVEDGAMVGNKPTPLAVVSGSARALLTAERVALNFLQRLSGVATLTQRYVQQIAGTSARIADTRKTTPGLRALEKYAVRAGGGFNHRLGLYDTILIKDNHIRAVGSIGRAVSAAKMRAPHTVKIEVEVSSLPQVEQALNAGADIILLDNMDLATMTQAVTLIGSRAITEASGGLTEDRLAAVAATGVQILSVGALTHSAPAMDISLDFHS
jgi:nicotinate-nucleotide pyrophosphorylase (carboxylating)